MRLCNREKHLYSLINVFLGLCSRVIANLTFLSELVNDFLREHVLALCSVTLRIEKQMLKILKE
jgi:hypothetical protein